jgi:hypothetical protein
VTAAPHHTDSIHQVHGSGACSSLPAAGCRSWQQPMYCVLTAHAPHLPIKHTYVNHAGAPAVFVHAQGDAERDVEAWLRRKFEGRIREVEVVMKEDLDLVRLCSAWHSSSSMQARRAHAGSARSNRAHGDSAGADTAHGGSERTGRKYDDDASAVADMAHGCSMHGHVNMSAGHHRPASSTGLPPSYHS